MSRLIYSFACKWHELPLIWKNGKLFSSSFSIHSDELTPSHAGAKYVLVDHHVSNTIQNIENIVEVVDHRPLDPNARFHEHCRVTLQEVGSCATLIAQLVLTSTVSIPIEHKREMLSLLHAAIILDTVNFSSSADKARELDVSIVNQIEDVTGFDFNDRKHLFNELIKARSDVSLLTPYQLLLKDLKIIYNPSNSIVVAIPGFPILVEVSQPCLPHRSKQYKYLFFQDFAEEEEDASDAIISFGKNKNCDLIIIMGLTHTEDGEIRRDMGIFPIKETPINNTIIEKLQSRDELDLDLAIKDLEMVNLPLAKIFEQKNVRASRKQIMPIIQGILNTS